MFQSSINIPEEAFEDLTKEFHKTVQAPVSLFNNDPSEWDLEKPVVIKWACAWNDPDMVDKEALILQKNNQIAIVQLSTREETEKFNVLQRVFRLEDLQVKEA